jgi:hypothetical protein
MPTTLPEVETPTSETQSPELPDATYLEDQTPDWFKTPRSLFGFTTVIGAVYWIFSYRPLWHTDLWGHLSYGRLLWQSQRLPSTEPLMPLSSGVPFVDTAWLSQLIGYGAMSAFGIPAMQFLYAGSITLCVALLAWRFFRRTGNTWISIAGLAAFVWLNWQQLFVVRPQLAGLVCFVSLLATMTSRHWSRANWVVIPLLFALWANLHGSFPVGLAYLGCLFVGRACDVAWRTRSLGSIFRDAKVRRYFLLAELAAAATLLNPYGLALYAEIISVSGNANFADLVEWEPLTLRMRQGWAAAAIAIALMFVYRRTPRRVSTTEVLLLLGLGAATLWISRMIVWWAPVAAYYLVLHGGAVWKQLRSRRPLAESPKRRSLWSVVSLGLIWIFFAYTPFGITVIHGSNERFEQSVSKETPVEAVKYLNEYPPVGQVFNTYEWGDYLTWAGPRSMQVFVASHVHLVPREVWQDYLGVINVSSGWEAILDRYSVNTVIVDPLRRDALIDRLRRDDQWTLGFEDNRAVVFNRRNPI